MTSIKKSKRAALKAFFLIAILKFFAPFPCYITRRLAYVLGRLSCWMPGKMKSTIRKNIQFCFPKLSVSETEVLVNKVVMENAKLILELPFACFGKKSKVEGLITQVNNQYLVDQYTANKQPLIVAVPHIGNWEIFWNWLQLNYPTIAMYSPVKIPQLDKAILCSRQRFGGEPFATDPKGIMALLRSLKKGSVMMILPDQAPRRGAGTFTPFFGKPAYTMTLLHKFMQKTGANLLFGSCLRNKNKPGFNITLHRPDFDTDLVEAETFNTKMNQQIESMILRSPEQYQWSYKRFKRQADGVNPYK